MGKRGGGGGQDTYKVVMNTTKCVITAPKKVLSFRNWNGKNLTRAKYFSHTTNAARPTTPITIMTMMLALCHECEAELTRLNGRVMSVNPPEMRIAPTTRFG